MSFSLLKEKWIPVVTASGKFEKIGVEDITQDDAPVYLNSIRSDFNLSITEFLIGIMQTLYAPANRKEWDDKRVHPPSGKELKKVLAPHIQNFFLLGNNVRFMQDLAFLEDHKKKFQPIGFFVFGQPGASTIKDNRDFFVARDTIKQLCPACASMNLLGLQSFATSGGAGFRTSIRGGGPLTTFLKGKNLWETIWLNVLPLNEDIFYPLDKASEQKVFPWLEPSLTSKLGEVLSEQDYPLQHCYWGMPRRIWLFEEKNKKSLPCSICGEVHPTIVTHCAHATHGMNYGPTWRHPLTPYRHAKGDFYTIKGQKDTKRYTNWLGFTIGEPAMHMGKVMSNMTSALCISEHASQYAESIIAQGFNFDQAKVVSWCNFEFPLYHIEGDKEEYQEIVTSLYYLMRLSVKSLNQAIQFAFGNDKASTDCDFYNGIASQFWNDSESIFYATCKILASCKDKQDPRYFEALEAWGKEILKLMKNLYAIYIWNKKQNPSRMETAVITERKMIGAMRKVFTKQKIFQDSEEELKAKES